MSQLESDLQSKIIRVAEARGWFAVKIVSPSRRGMPDVYAVRAGRHIWIEVKRAGEELRLQQRRVTRLLRDHGAEVFVIDRIEEACAVFE